MCWNKSLVCVFVYFLIYRVYIPQEHGKRNQMKFHLQTSNSQLPIIILYKNPVTEMGRKNLQKVAYNSLLHLNYVTGISIWQKTISKFGIHSALIWICVEFWGVWWVGSDISDFSVLHWTNAKEFTNCWKSKL